MNPHLLDILYNHKAIIEALVQSGYPAALKCLHDQADRLHDLVDSDHSDMRCIFLNSLNRCIYNFILFTWDISLAQCCFENKATSHQFNSEEQFLNAGEEILKSYTQYIYTKSTRTFHVDQACRYIDTHLEEELTLEAVSQKVFVSKSYLSQMFKEHVGKKFTEYVNEQRLIKARRLLLTTDLKIDEIADTCGFLSSTYFSTAFKKSTKMPPSTFRQRYSGI